MIRLISVVALLFLLVACDSGAPESDNYSLEHQAAIVNAGHYVPETDISVARMRFLLDSLQATTGYSKIKILDQASATRNIIRKEYGREVMLIDLLEAANKSDAVRSKTVKLEEYFALYAGLASQ